MAARLRLNEIQDIKEHRIFLDANIWIYLFCEIGNYNKKEVSAYSNVFSEILKNRLTVFTDITVMSEFINRYLRIAFTNYKNSIGQKYLNYKKDYKKTDDYKSSLKVVYSIVKKKILPHTNIADHKYDKNSFEKLLNENNIDIDIDFNDAHIASVCSKNNLYLMTHDGDFKNVDINIISFNKTFWKQEKRK